MPVSTRWQSLQSYAASMLLLGSQESPPRGGWFRALPFEGPFKGSWRGPWGNRRGAEGWRSMKQGRGGWNLKMKSRLTEGLWSEEGGWNLKMKSRLRLKVCESRQRDVEFKDEVQIETEGLWSKVFQMSGPSESPIWKMWHVNCANWAASWIVALFQQVMKSARHKKHYCCPALHKVLAPRQKNSMQTDVIANWWRGAESSRPTSRVLASRPRIMMIGKGHLSGIWEDSEGRVRHLLTLDLFHTLFHLLLCFTFPFSTWHCHC